MQASPGPPRFADRGPCPSKPLRAALVPFIRPVTGILFSLCWQAHSIQSPIAHSAFWLLIPRFLPYPAGISRAKPFARLWRRLSVAVSALPRTLLADRQASVAMSRDACRHEVSAPRSPGDVQNVTLATGLLPRANHEEIGILHLRYTSPSFPGLTLWLPLPRSFRLPDGRRFAGPSFAIAGSPRLSATSEAGCRIRRARG